MEQLMKSMPQSASRRECAQVNLNFRNVRLKTVLDHLQESAGLPIAIKGNVQMERTIDLWQDQPVTLAEALALLKQRLMTLGCTLIQKGAAFSIIGIEEAKKTCIALPGI
jgi:type II secretory pathway component GspD/PulD (secretin)